MRFWLVCVLVLVGGLMLPAGIEEKELGGTYKTLYNALPYQVKGQIRDKVISSVIRASERFQIDPALVMAVCYTESKGDPTAKSKGNYGLMQLNAASIIDFAEQYVGMKVTRNNLLDPEINTLLGAAVLKYWMDKYRKKYRGLDLYAVVLRCYNHGHFSPNPMQFSYVRNVLKTYKYLIGAEQ